jgi:hypothetical protein
MTNINSGPTQKNIGIFMVGDNLEHKYQMKLLLTVSFKNNKKEINERY